MQQSFFSAWSAFNLGTEIRQLRAWLYRITHNHAIDALRRGGYDFDELNESLRGADAPEFDLERRTLMRETLAAVVALPELQREAILRTAVEGQSYEEVASALGVTDTAVRGLVYRARASVRTCLGALAPPPLVLWAASQTRRTGALHSSPRSSRPGGSAGGAAVAIKSVSILTTSVAVVGGRLGQPLGLTPVTSNPERHRRAESRSSPRTGQRVVPADRSWCRRPSLGLRLASRFVIRVVRSQRSG